MEVYRLCRREFAALDGEGARLYGGRWTPPGVPAVYTSSSRPLAALEYLAHLEPEDAPDDLVLLTIEVAAHVTVQLVDPDGLPADWKRHSEHPGLQAIGDAWAQEGIHAALSVPSVLLPEERNLIFNPRHTDGTPARTTSRRPFGFDARLLG